MMKSLIQNRHFQTIWPNYFRRTPSLEFTTQRLTLPDGDFMDINIIKSESNFQYNKNKKASEGKGVVLIFHGLGGSIDSHYAQALINNLQQNHYTPIFVHFRGASGEPNNKPYSYHAGKADDIAFVIDAIRNQQPQAKLFAVGISIGGSALLNYLGHYQIDNPLTGAIAISVPYDLEDAATSLNKGLGKVYQHYLLRCQKLILKQKFQTMHCPIDFQRAIKAKDFFEFDDAATAPLHGFQGVMDYYHQCSAKQYLKHIKTPTLLIHAKDDPFMSKKSIPLSTDLSENVTLDLHNRGGHVGFIKGQWPWDLKYYLDQRILEFLKLLT